MLRAAPRNRFIHRRIMCDRGHRASDLVTLCIQWSSLLFEWSDNIVADR